MADSENEVARGKALTLAGPGTVGTAKSTCELVDHLNGGETAVTIGIAYNAGDRTAAAPDCHLSGTGAPTEKTVNEK